MAALAKVVRHFDEADFAPRRGKQIEQDLETMAGDIVRDLFEEGALEQKEAAHRVAQPGSDHEPAQRRTEPAHGEPAAAELAGAAADGEARADDDIDLRPSDRVQHSRQRCLVVLQVGVHDGEERGRGREPEARTDCHARCRSE
jgi:hypothetical protein